MPAGIAASQRNRPAEISGVGQALTRSPLIGRAMSEKAVGSGKLSADNVAALVMADKAMLWRTTWLRTERQEGSTR